MTCRCPMCGRKNASDRFGLGSYRKVGLRVDEHGVMDGLNKPLASRFRRRRGKQLWRVECRDEIGGES